ncbi:MULTISPECIES: TetR/AcrR family transcriptional regulator [unclassified Pseudomonas]|uniref:TetR/AcrR family transcriptional regulator n=1 Tax=unclassified Pseudomonas TaxID=196821 RepID=UPI000BE486AE|nr:MULTISPECIES: TetR/AcrR family transcriptional regulator [unclassified Pseudomonas]
MVHRMPAHPDTPKPASRIRQKNQAFILRAAEEEFACHGFKGTSMNAIALKAGLPKANLHYYFTSKLGLYAAVLANVLALWETSFNHLRATDDPAQALATYIRAKMAFSRQHPHASRVFALEVISGGHYLTEHFGADYRQWFRGRAAVFEHWIANGQMDPVDPIHLIFLLWSSTQHYADFTAQICQVTGSKRLNRHDFDVATDNLIHIVLKGCGIKAPQP